MVSVLATGPKVHGLKSNWSNGFLRAITICNKNTSQFKIHHSLRPFLLLSIRWLLIGLPESSGRWIRSFPLSTSFHHGSPCSFISWGWTTGLLVAAAQRHSLTMTSSSSTTTIHLKFHKYWYYAINYVSPYMMTQCNVCCTKHVGGT
jgi:hypothetical protein